MRVSIIIPVYNVEKYILECLNSVANQTLTEGVECILVDDCGKDNSIELAENFIAGYSGDISFRIIYHDKNKGLSAARNSAIYVARGEYLFFLDSDDYIVPTCIEEMWKLVEKYPNVEIVQGFYFRDIKHLSDPPLCKYPDYINNRSRLRFNISHFRITDAGCNKLVRKDFIINNDILFKEGYTQEDTIWAFDIQRCISNMAFCKKYTYFYRETPNSIMTSLTKEKEAIDFAKVFDVSYEKVKNNKEIYDVLFLAMITHRVWFADPIVGKKVIPSCNKIFSNLVHHVNSFKEATSKYAKIYHEIIILFYCYILKKTDFI